MSDLRAELLALRDEAVRQGLGAPSVEAIDRAVAATATVEAYLARFPDADVLSLLRPYLVHAVREER